jgi:hypothetical protein
MLFARTCGSFQASTALLRHMLQSCNSPAKAMIETGAALPYLTL